MINWLKKHLFSYENPAVPLAEAMDYVTNGRGPIVVNKAAVLRIPAAWRALTLTSQKVGKLPLPTYFRAEDDSREKDKQHPAWQLLMRRPGPNLTPFVWKQTTVFHFMVHGNAFSAIHRKPNGDGYELEILDPEKVYAAWEGGVFFYAFHDRGTIRRFLPENILHFKGMSDDGIMGISILDKMAPSFGLSLALQEYQLHYFSQGGGRPKVALMLPQGFGDDETKMDRFRKTFANKHGGMDNNIPALIPSGGDIKPLGGGSNEAAQLGPVLDNSIRDMANGFGVPASSMMVADSYTSHNSLESQQKQFLADSLDGILTIIEEELCAKLLRVREFELDTHYIEFTREALEQTDATTKNAIIIDQVNNGLRSEESAQQLLNLPTNQKGMFRRPSGVTLFKDGKPWPEVPKPEPAPPEAPSDDEEAPQDDPNAEDESEDESEDKGFAADAVALVIGRVRNGVNRGKELDEYREFANEKFRHWTAGTETANQFFDELGQELSAICKADREKIDWARYEQQILKGLN